MSEQRKLETVLLFLSFKINIKSGNLYLVQVSKIITDVAGRACGVQVKKGGEELAVMAPIIISDAGGEGWWRGVIHSHCFVSHDHSLEQ